MRHVEAHCVFGEKGDLGASLGVGEPVLSCDFFPTELIDRFDGVVARRGSPP